MQSADQSGNHAESFFNDAEIWKPITGFEGYEVSSVGRVRRGSSIKALRPDRKGYLQVSLWRNGKSFTRMVNKLVAGAFLGSCPEGQVTRHRNGTKTDNRDSNLRYGTRQENEADKIEHGTQCHGEAHGRAKLTVEIVLAIRRRHEKGSATNGTVALAREFGVDPSLITRIVKRKIWANV